MNQINLQKYEDLQYDKFKNNYSTLPVYGPYEKLLVTDWGQSRIDPDIAMAFSNMDINQMTPIQQHSFLYLLNYYNTVMIGFSKGKSIAYLASIFSLIMNDNEIINDTNDDIVIGPKAVILSSSLGSCTILESLSKKFNNALPKTKKIHVVVAYSFIPVLQIIGTLINGCDILIATPSSLLNILHKTDLFKWTNLKFVVFDNIDLLLENYDDQMIYFLNYFSKLKTELNKKIQLISSSVTWSMNIEHFLNLLFIKWQYIFGSHLEATRYMRIGFHLVQVQNDKLQQILEFLKANIKCRRCVLMVSDSNELNLIYEYIKKNSSNIEVLLPGLLRSSKVYTLQKWHQPLFKNQLIFICSDDMMFDFYIDNADCLIHYDIPVNKGPFSIRFSVLQDPNNIFTNKERSTYIFLSDNCKDMIELPKVVDIMKAFGNGMVEPFLLKYAKTISDYLENQKRNSIFCNNIEQFGCCPKSTVCKNRHILLKELDKPAVNIPKSGLAIVKIINVYDSSRISAKLLKVNSTSNLSDDQNWTEVVDNSKIIDSKLKSFFSNNNSRILHKEPSPGDIVAVEIETKFRDEINTVFLRAVVFDSIDAHTINPKVIVRLIDQGRVEIVSKFRVFVLPDLLKSIETNTVNIIIASIKPVDNDKTWCIQANTSVKNQLKNVDDYGDTIIIKIKMVLGTTILANKLYKKYWHSKLKLYSTEEILPVFLLNSGYADVNPNHIEVITNLSILAGIIKPLLENNIQQKPNNHQFSLKQYMSLYKLPQPQWAHLEEDCSLVSVEYICSPKLFFLRNIKYIDRFNDIQIMIRDYVNQKLVKKLQLSHIVEGAICLAKYIQSDQYYRIKILSILDTLVEIMFVDIGEIYSIESDLLLTIHPDLIVQLPFQAIECSLSGFKDEKLTSNELEDQIDYFFNLTQNQLSIKVVKTVGLGELTGGIHYEVVLHDEHNIVNIEMQKQFSQHWDETQTLILSTIVNDSNDDYCIQKDNTEQYSINIDNILDEDETGESWPSYMQLMSELGFFEQFNLKLDENTVTQIEKVQENNLKEKTIQQTTSKTPTEIENKNANNCTTVDVIEKNKSVDLVPHGKISKSKGHKLKRCRTRKDICFTCNTNVHSIVPACVWYQDEKNINLKFNILKVDDYYVKYVDGCLIFKVQFNDLTYNFCAKLYGAIFENCIVIKRSYEGFHIKAEKMYKMEFNWPKLFRCNKWHKYLKYDPEHLEIKYDMHIKFKAIDKFKFLATGSFITTNPCFDSETDDEFSYDITED